MLTGETPTAAAISAPSALGPGRPRARIVTLDVLRGFALCGIILVNIEPLTWFGRALGPSPTTLSDPSGWLQLLVQQRFFPIFSLLFGMGFTLFLRSAEGRAGHPRVLLLRRLLVLLVVGIAHQLLHPGEALTGYAVLGLLVLLPSSWPPRWVVAVGAGALIFPVALLGYGGVPLVPGLFLLGSALVRYGVVDRIEERSRWPMILCAGFAAVSVPAVIWQAGELRSSGFSASSAVAGLLMAGAYVTGILVLLMTRARPVLAAVFVPLGRMALTNYVSATPIMLLAGHVLDLPRSESWAAVFLVAVAILVAQGVFSTLWLGRFGQGPLEWLWRWATWWQRPPLRHGAVTAVPPTQVAHAVANAPTSTGKTTARTRVQLEGEP